LIETYYSLFVFIVDLNRMAERIFNPQACQNVISGRPNIVGINQFHSTIKGAPNSRQANINRPTTSKIL
jgi:hypothetical protein